MRVCGYWVIKVFDEAKDNDVVLEGEVYDSLGNRVAGSKFTGMEARGEFDNDVNSHWGEEEGRVYGNDIGACDEYEEEEDMCSDCGGYISECSCGDYCPDCGEELDYCTCDDGDEMKWPHGEW
jgi:hypothetical protein